MKRRWLPRTRTRGALILVSAVLGAGITSVIANNLRPGAQQRLSTTTTTTAPTDAADRSSTAAGGWAAVAPDTTVPADSPVQQFYDENLAAGLTGGSNQASLATAASLPLPPPKMTGAWPALAPEDTPEGWVGRFVPALLGIDFARQTRPGLAGWVVAQEAPDLMPGIPPDAQLTALYTTLFVPQATGQSTPIPDQAVWHDYAEKGVRWTANDLHVTVDPSWQRLLTAGWQPRDLRSVVEDVTGTLTVARPGTGASQHRFSMVLQLGSAHWHPGYGTVLVSGWKEA